MKGLIVLFSILATLKKFPNITFEDMLPFIQCYIAYCSDEKIREIGKPIYILVKNCTSIWQSPKSQLLLCIFSCIGTPFLVYYQGPKSIHDLFIGMQ